MKNFNKKMQRVFKGVIKPKIFLILFAFLFSSLAFAASLTVTWLDGRIPSHNSNFCKNSAGEYTLNKDSTEDPYDVAFSTDGLQVFSVNFNQSSAHSGYGNMNMNRLSRPFDMTSVISDQLTTPGKPSLNCDDIDSFKIGTLAGFASTNRLRNIVVADGGSKFFISNSVGRIMRFDLSTPNEFKTNTFVQSIVTHAQMHGFALSNDGKKLITIRFTDSTPLVTTYQLPSPYDISSITQIHQVDLTDIGVTLPDTSDGSKNYGRDIEFSKSGHAMFVLIQNTKGNANDTDDIYQFTLGKKFDVSTAKLVGNYDANNFQNQSDNFGHPIGFTFSTDGMRMFIVDIDAGGGAVDQINSYQLECPYGLVACVSDPTASIGSQVELAKQNITQNVSVIFKRFEWIKRNRDQEDFTSHNINLNFPNPILEALAMKVEPTTKRTMAKLISTNQKKGNKSKWSSWSLGEISFGDYDKLGFENQKRIKAKGLIFGADRKLDQNKFLGWALRYGNSSSNVTNSVQGVDMESFTLNLYGTIPRDDYRYINTVLGLSVLNFDNKYNGKLSGERNGKQAFASINYRTKNSYGALHFTPTLKIDYGVTRLSEFTDFISTTIDGPTTDIRYAEDTFKSGELATGFLFETDKFDVEFGTFQPMGSIEYVYDLTPDVNYKYTQQGETIVSKDKIIGKYSESSLKTNIGFEAIYSNGFTVSPSYERTFSLSHDNDSKKVYSERLIVKFSRSKEDNNSEYAFNFEPLADDKTGSLSYVKNINGFDLKLNSNFDFKNNINYLTNFEVSGKF